ncbi:MAG: pyrroloquinoline quinone biosynthesis protein PqqB [Proteobacteria bacterium]|nr:pyrroloquinoline quinone biosynthesis protein PqqB [Pseudomonadota bacterium]
MLRILVLGAAAGGGFPQWNSNSEACNRARRGDAKAKARTQSSLAVSADGEHWVVLNASPDIRHQINENPALHPRKGARHSPISAVVLTNGDVDHVAGLLTLRESTPFTIHASDRVLAVLKANSIFNVLNPEFVSRSEIALEAPFAPAPGLEIEAFAVPGKVALYLEDGDSANNFGTRDGDTIGLSLHETATGQKFFYIPGCAAMPDDLAQRLAGAALVLFDGTLFENDEMITRSEGIKTGRRMGHMSISGPEGVLAAFENLDVARRIFIHINNTNPVLLDDSPERAAVEAAGWEVAWDGMEIEL